MTKYILVINLEYTLTDQQITLYTDDGYSAVYVYKATDGNWCDGDGSQYQPDALSGERWRMAEHRTRRLYDRRRWNMDWARWDSLAWKLMEEIWISVQTARKCPANAILVIFEI